MTDNYFLSKEVKIKVPRILDDPVAGRVLALPFFSRLIAFLLARITNILSSKKVT
jgi:hypothetical protein